MPKKSLYILLGSLLIGLAIIGLVKTNQTPKYSPPIEQPKTQQENVKTTQDYIVEALSRKYATTKENVKIEVLEEKGNFAKGSVNFNNEHSGALWFAIKQSGGWELVYDGNGIMPCDIANGKDLPTSMVPACIDTQNDNTFVQR